VLGEMKKTYISRAFLYEKIIQVGTFVLLRRVKSSKGRKEKRIKLK